jgi:site-specific DNA-methyltransferase (adenine-specific)
MGDIVAVEHQSVEELHRLARESASNTVQYAIACGQELMRVKASLPHGQFGRWCEGLTFSYQTANAYMKVAKATPNLQRARDLESTSLRGLLSAIKAERKEATREARKQQLEAAQEVVEEARRDDIDAVCDLRVCSCAELFASGIRPDAVITDPPYPAEFLPVFSELAHSCRDAQVPLVAVMSGQSYLPDVMNRLCEHLRYRWTLAYVTPGGQAVQQWQAKVNTFWKPVLLFGEAEEWFGDVATSRTNDNDKRFHEWGQSESGMADLVERLTKPGQLVCDPFLGGGTTAVVSLALGRRFVGCDIDPAHVEKTWARVIPA